MEVRVGTSGCHYDHWRGVFYPEGLPKKKWLAYYAEHFDTVELNNTFYRLPTEKGVGGWYEDTPKGFLFALKGSRFLTHTRRLADRETGVERYFSSIAPLGNKRGPILFQLPPRWKRDPGRLDAFLEALPPRLRYAVELRDPDWHHPDVYRVLRKRRAAFCIFQKMDDTSPVELTTDFTYVRFHGTGSKYGGRYSKQTLRAWAKRIRGLNVKRAFVYFNNDEAGYAVMNAAEIREML